MPLFARISRIPSADDSISIPPQGFVAGSKLEYAEPVRPQTSGGQLKSKRSQHLRPVPSHERLSPLATIRRTHSTLTLDTAGATATEGVGIAYGSPSELPQITPFGASTTYPDSPVATSPRIVATPPRSTTAPQDETPPSDRPSIKRWRTMSGIFARKRTPTTPVLRVDEIPPIPAPAPVLESARPGTSRGNSLFVLTSKALSPVSHKYSPSSLRSSRTPIQAPTPGAARSHETWEDAKSPQLDVQIPDSLFDRYSILFAKPIGAVSADVVENPNTTPVIDQPMQTRPVSSMQQYADEAKDVEPARVSWMYRNSSYPESDPQTTPPPLPMATTVTSPSEVNAHLERKGSIVALEVLTLDAISPETKYSTPSSTFLEPGTPDLQSPETFWDSAPSSPVSSRASSTFSFSTAARSSERQKAAPTALPAFSFPALPATNSVKAERPVVGRSLSVPTTLHSAAASWDFTLPSPLSAAAPSPSMKYGYDEPGTPYICVAESVTVTLRSEQGQKPKFVFREKKDLQKSREVNCVSE